MTAPITHPPPTTPPIMASICKIFGIELPSGSVAVAAVVFNIVAGGFDGIFVVTVVSADALTFCLSMLPPLQTYPSGQGSPVGNPHPAGQYLPILARHGSLSLEPPAQYHPAGHSSPAADSDPAGQNRPIEAVQSVHEVAPEAAAYLPASHLVQACSVLRSPHEFLKKPAAHKVQLPPSGPVLPGGQVQLVADVLPVFDVEPTGQPEQAAGPDDGLYLPASQAAHFPPSGPVLPGGHVLMQEPAELPPHPLRTWPDAHSPHVEHTAVTVIGEAIHRPAGPQDSCQPEVAG